MEILVLQMRNSLLNKLGDFAMRILSEFYVENGANAKFAKQNSPFFSKRVKRIQYIEILQKIEIF